MLRRHSSSTDDDDIHDIKTTATSRDDIGTITSRSSSPKKAQKTIQCEEVRENHITGTHEAKRETKGGITGMEQPEWRRPRLRGPWRASLLVLCTTALSLLLLFNVISSFMTRQKDAKGCGKVLMAPMYAKYEGFDTEHTRFASKYGLYLYREGGVNEDFTVKGVPVLFITGNAGSHKQVRSIASEATRYWDSHVRHLPGAQARGLRDFDFFTADFNEDITAFHGRTMLDQAEYLNDAIAYILSLYHDPQNPRRDPGQPDPTSVMILGHSMGGIVARTMLTLPNYQANSVNTIITLSSPHARAPVSFDEDIVAAYSKVNSYWRQSYSQQWATDNPLSQVTTISIAGGGLDTMVPSDYTSLASLVPPSHGFTVYTSTSPLVWTGCDHLAIIWCDQLRKSIAKAMFDIVDARVSGQTKSRAERMQAFRKRFLTGMERHIEKPTLPEFEPVYLKLEEEGNDILPAGERLVLRSKTKTQDQTYLMPIPADSELSSGKKFVLMTDRQANEEGDLGDLKILLCSVYPLHSGGNAALSPRAVHGTNTGIGSSSTKLACRSAASEIIHLPASTTKSTSPSANLNSDGFVVSTDTFSYLQYDLEDISDYQFIAVLDQRHNDNHNWLVAEFADDSVTDIRSDAGLFQLLTSGVSFTLPAGRSFMTNIKIPVMVSSLLAYKLRVSTQSCAGNQTPLFSPLVRQYMEQPYESKYFVNVREADINLHGVAPFMPSPLQSAVVNDGLSLQIWSDATCGTSMQINLVPDIRGSLGKFVMRFRAIFPAVPLVIIALVLRKQFVVHDKTGVFITFFDSLSLCMKSSIPVLLFSMTMYSVALSGNDQSSTISTWQANATAATTFSENDLLLGSSDPLFWFLIPIAGLLGVGACVLMNYAALAMVHVLHSISSVITDTASKFRRHHQRRLTGNVFFNTPPRRRIIITLTLFLLIVTVIPYQFAYLVACVVQIITCTRALRAVQEVHSSAPSNFYNYAHSILVLMLWVLPINIPVLVVWIHNLAVHWLTPFSSHHNVFTIMPFLVLVESLTGGTMIPRVTTSWRHITNILFFILAVYAALYGVTYAYQLHDIANVIAGWLVLVQISSSNISFSRLTRIVEGKDEVDEHHVKKKP